MRFTAGVIVGMAIGRPVLKKVYTPLRPYIVNKIADIAVRFIDRITEENKNR